MCTDDRRPKEPRGGPLPFRIELTSSPDILDAKGRQVQLPTLRPSDEKSAEDRARTERKIDLALLQQMRDNPDATQQQWADAIGRAKSSLNGRLQRLGREKLAQDTLGKWSLTAKGRKALQDDPEQQVAKNIEK